MCLKESRAAGKETVRQQGEMGSLQEISQECSDMWSLTFSLLFLSDSPFFFFFELADGQCGVMDVFIVSPGVPGGWWQSKD